MSGLRNFNHSAAGHLASMTRGIRRLAMLVLPGWHQADMVAAAMFDGSRARDEALSVLNKHGINAQLYLAAAGETDRELADALRLMAGRGYIMTDKNGGLVGAVAQAIPSSEEIAQNRRASFRVVWKADHEHPGD